MSSLFAYSVYSLRFTQIRSVLIPESSAKCYLKFRLSSVITKFWYLFSIISQYEFLCKIWNCNISISSKQNTLPTSPVMNTFANLDPLSLSLSSWTFIIILCFKRINANVPPPLIALIRKNVCTVKAQLSDSSDYYYYYYWGNFSAVFL